MNKEIRPKGLTLSPDDRAATPGELAVCAGVELHDGTLRPSFVDGTEVKTLVAGSTVHTLIYVHEGASYTNYITTASSNLYYWRKTDVGQQTSPTKIEDVTGTIEDITSVGNTLCIVTTTGIHYVLFKDGVYKYLGTQPPFVNIQFSLVDVTYTGDTIQKLSKATGEMFDLGNQQEGDAPKVAIKEEYRSEFTENAYALINRVHNDITNEGHFYAPFYVRYCLRLYDGTSLVRHSAPVLMPVCIGHEDYVNMNCMGVDISATPHKIKAAGTNEMQLHYIAAKLQYKGIGYGWTELQNWSDIVASLDVFISAPITRTRQGELIKFVGVLPDTTYELRNGKYGPWKYAEFPSTSYVYVHMPELDDDSYREKRFSPDVFFKIASFGLNHSIPSYFEDFPVQGSTLAALSAQESMKDDYRSHHILKPDSSGSRHSFVYNKRLHIFAAEENLFDGFTFNTMLPYIDDTTTGAEQYNYIYVKIATDDGVKVVVANCLGWLNDNVMKMLPMFYPDSRAVEMTVTYETISGGVRTFVRGKSQTMTRLPLLEGSRTIGEYVIVSLSPSTTAKAVPSPNRIFVSEINNPFFFPLEARQTVGVGTIYGLGVATRAISPGQFGDHDLMVFCSDGIWALSVNRQTGTYSSSHNVSREVCSNPKSICQLDQSIVFATSRGLSRIVEQDAVSLSDALHGPMCDLSKMESLVSGFNYGDFSDQDIFALLNFAVSPVDAFQNTTTLYDYAKERIILIPSDAAGSEKPAYVLSLRDGSWSTTLLPAIKAVVNAYPHPYVEKADGTLLVLDKPFGYDIHVKYRFYCPSSVDLSSAAEGDVYKQGELTLTLTDDFRVQDNAFTAVVSGIGTVVPENGTLIKYSGSGPSTISYDTALCASVFTSALIVSRTLSFADTMQVIQGFQQMNDCLKKPVIFLYGSNDAANWRLIGKAQRNHAPYLPGHPYRFWRFAVYLQMLPDERYSSLILDVIEKYQKL